jgi:mannitol-1-/sugar-/sorbitol-6-/2-deoxyglucose-6-phosphatase
MIRGAIFDMDGLLVDSEPLWTRAEIEVFATVGIRLDESQCAQTIGMGLEQVVAFRYRQQPFSKPSREEVARAIHRRVVELVSKHARAMPGALQALEFVRSKVARIGLATASDHELIDAALGRLAIRDIFDHLQSAAELPRGKPDPEVYLLAARGIRVAPGECVAFEDSLLGLEAILAAGMKSVAVPERRLVSDERFSRANIVLESLERLDDQIWQRLTS